MLTFFKSRSQRSNSSKGFTIVELLTVIAIIGVLTTVVTVNVSSSRQSARDARRKSDIKAIQTALELYYNANGEFPALPWGTNSNTASWSNLELALKPYLQVLPKDPTNSEPEPWTAGALSYGYASANWRGCTAGQWYVLVYGLESENDVTPVTTSGVPMCDGTTYDQKDTGQIVTGVAQ